MLQIFLLGLLRQPKWGHLKQLHEVIKSCSTTLLQGVQRNFTLGQLLEVSALAFPLSNRFTCTNHNLNILKVFPHFDQVYVFEEEKGECVAFLINNDRDNKATVQFRNSSYELLPKSISILPDCQNVTFSTANVNYCLVKISYYIYTKSGQFCFV